MPFPNDIIRNKLALLTMCVIKYFFLTNTSYHISLLMPSFNTIWSTWATFRLVVVFFFNAHSDFVVVVNIAVFVDLPSSLFGKHFFFICSICNTKSFCIKTTDPHLINMLIMLLIWLIVVLLLLQTTHCRHRVFLPWSVKKKNCWCKMRAAFYAAS